MLTLELLVNKLLLKSIETKSHQNHLHGGIRFTRF